MTEAEAKTKWCPHARTVWGDGSTTDGAAFNRWTDAEPDAPEKPITRCIGSSCMAWRWDNDTAEIKNQPISDGAPPGEGWFQTWVPNPGDTHMTWKRITHGFCGLAGKP